MTYDFKSHRSGDTFNGLTVTVEVNNVALDLTGASIVATFIGQTNKNLKFEKSSTKIAEIEITDPASGIFVFKEQVIAFPAGIYDHAFKFTLADGDIKTYIRGTWEITE